MINILSDVSNWLIKKECIYILTNIMSTGNAKQVDYIVSCGCIKTLCDNLGSSMDNNIYCTILDGLYETMKWGRETGNEEKYADLIEDVDGIDKIEQAQNHQSENVYNKAVKLINEFFNDNNKEFIKSLDNDKYKSMVCKGHPTYDF